MPTPHKSGAPRIVWIENIRAVACVMVVILHVAAYYLYQFNKIDMTTWNLGNFIDSAVRVCVPLFFMISGYIFMSDKDMKARNIIKIFINLLFYSAVAFCYVLYFKVADISKLDFTILATDYLKKPVFYHLWFFYVILVCYFFFAFLSVKNISYAKGLFFISIVFIFFNSRTSSFTSLLFGFNYAGIMVITGSIPFFIAYSALGAILGNRQPKESNRYFYLLGFLIASGLTAYLTYNLSAKNNKFTQDFYAYESVLIMWASSCIFLYIKSLGDKKAFGILTPKIANASLPIYGVHAIILDLINSNNLRLDNALFDLPVTFFTVFICSFAIGLLISKVDKKRLIS